MRVSVGFSLAVAGLLAMLCARPATAENWPQWRGPANTGVSKEKNLPTKWDESTNIAWKLELPGIGFSTPAIWQDKIFVTCEDGRATDTPEPKGEGKKGKKKGPTFEGQLALLCVSTDGKLLWKAGMGKAIRSGNGDEGNAASPSPSTDGKAVYAFCGNGEVAAFDFAGKELWRFNAQDRYGKFRIAFGMHSTPVLFGDHLYFQFIHDGGGFVVCINKADGREVWKIERKSDGTAENRHSYASAFMWANGSEAFLVVHGNDYATAHRLTDGAEIWRVGDLNPQGPGYRRDLRFVASPLCLPNLIIIPSAKDKSIVAIRPDAQGMVNAGSKHEQWRHDKGTPDVAAPLVYDGVVYLVGNGGSLAALDEKTGTPHYRVSPGKGRHRANPVFAEGKVYITGRDSGEVVVVEAGKEYKKLATNKLPDSLMGSPAISGGRIYLRGDKYLWAVGEKK